jgi:YXWGXW repeat-containing protein
MKVKWLASMTVLPLLAACYVSEGAYVETAPPPARVVVVDPRPGYLWIDGRWDWSGGRWIWVDGYWDVARPGFAYVQGGWVRGPRGYVYRRGYWNRAPAGAVVHDYSTSGGVYRGAPASRTYVVPTRAPAGTAAPGGTVVHDHAAPTPRGPAPAAKPATSSTGGDRVHEHR